MGCFSAIAAWFNGCFFLVASRWLCPRVSYPFYPYRDFPY
jgi:hypothetical protein